MNARSLFEIATNAAAQQGQREKGQPVRRHSYFPDDRRALAMWKPLDKKVATVAERLTAAERYDRDMRKQGERMGPLGEIGLAVYRVMHFLIDKKGRLDPAIDYIAAKIRRSRKAVVAALARLKEHGFLDWVRRAEPVDEAQQGEKGPQVKQISNAYVLKIPKLAMDFIRGRKGPAAPVCEEDRRAAHKEEKEEMLDSLPLAELPGALVENDSLREILGRMGASLSVSNANSPRGQIQGHRG
jgi:hypothetical protein